MGILNVTPDSFSDGGRFVAPDSALRQAEQMVAEGADLLDVGGESTRPGAAAVELNEEMDRVLPIVERLSAAFDVPVSVDTSKPDLMRAAITAGAGMINDVAALRADGAIDVLVNADVAICLMHMLGEPRTMQQNPHYSDVVEEVIDFLRQRVAACEAAGIQRERLAVDPGFGFGKALTHNLTLLRELQAFSVLDLPLLIGVSRKSMLYGVTGRPVEQRLPASLAAVVMAVERGARIVRVHDVAPTVDALRIWEATTFDGVDGN